MTARRKVIYLEDSPRENLRRKVANRIANRDDFEEVEKDMHLVEAALETDRIIVSTDAAARTAFGGLVTKGVGELSQIGWLNPDDEQLNIDILSEDEELLDSLPKLGG